MIITCDPDVNMGYIYLQKAKRDANYYLENRKIYEYVKPEEVDIPITENDSDILNKISKLKISKKTYIDLLDTGEIDEEFLNDKDKDRYLLGIELTLKKEDFINNIKKKNYKIYNLNWRDKDFILVTLDSEEEVFNINNIIYAANKNEDVFYIVNKGDYNIGYIKGLLSSREDLYPREYLAEVNFVLF